MTRASPGQDRTPTSDAGVNATIAQMVKIVNQPFSYFLVLVLAQSAHHIAQHADQILRPIGYQLELCVIGLFCKHG